MLRLIQGDTAPDLQGYVSNGKARANMVGATAEAHLKYADGTILIRPAVFTNAAQGEWRMDWQTGDLSKIGLIGLELQVTYSNGKPQTFRYDAKGYTAQIHVSPQIA